MASAFKKKKLLFIACCLLSVSAFSHSLPVVLSPWYNRTCWLGVKHQLTYLKTYSSCASPGHLQPSWLTARENNLHNLPFSSRTVNALEQQASLQGFLSSVQHNMISVRSEKPICAPPGVSLNRFPKVAFETVSMFLWLSMALSRSLKENRLSTSLSSRRSVV